MKKLIWILCAAALFADCRNKVEVKAANCQKEPDKPVQAVCILKAEIEKKVRIFSAMPSEIKADKYYASIEKSGKYLGKTNIKNQIEYLENIGSKDAPEFFFVIPNETGEYTFTIYACTAGYTGNSQKDDCSAYARKKIHIQEGTKAIDVGKMQLQGNILGTAKGNTNLKLNLAGTGIARINITASKNNSPLTPSPFKAVITGSGSSLSGKITAADPTGVLSGSYEIVMRCYNSSGEEILISEPVQIINIFPSCTTDKWYNSAGAAQDSLSFETINPAEATVFYVKGEGGILDNISASDNNSGISMGAPLKTAKKAFEKCTDSSKEYAVYIDGTVKEAGDIAASKNITVKALSRTAVLEKNAASVSNLIKVLSGSLTLESIHVKGGVSVEGGAFKISGSTKILSDVSRTDSIYLKTGRTITIEGILSEASPIAEIKPEAYSVGVQVLEAGAGTNLAVEKAKFTVTQQDLGGGSGAEWGITDDGKLKQISAVIKGGSGAWKKLKETVASIPEGGTIIIDGEIKATSASNNNGEIVINKNLTIEGKTGKATDILNADKDSFGAAPFRIFKVEAGKKLTLKNLTLKGGKNNENDPGGPPNPNGKGGAVYSKGELEIRNVLITECEAKHEGGGIYCKMAGSSNTDERKFLMEHTDVTDCKVSDPSHGTGGGVYISGGDCLMNVKMTAVKIKNNKADKLAAGFHLSVGHGAKTTADSVVLTNVTLEENELTDPYNQLAGGGGMAFSTYGIDNTIILQNCTVTKNKTNSQGGGIRISTSTSSNIAGKLILEDCTIEQNKAQNGGGVYINKSNLVLKNSTLTDNTVTQEGGGVYVKDGCSLTLEHMQITGNKAGKAGGAVCAKGATVTMENCNLKGNQAKEDGGAVFAEKEGTTPADITIKGGTIGGEGTDGNEATDPHSFGGGIYVNDDCSLTLEHVQITGNKAGRAGGIRANRSTVTIKGCTITKNRAEGSHGDSGGGGVYTNGGTLDMTGCTLTGNKAENNGGGMNIEGTTVTIKDCTIKGNTAQGDGGGVYVKDGNFTINGSTQIAENNDIYLKNGKKITIEGALTSEFGVRVARITPETYPTAGNDVQVLAGNITAGDPQNNTKFTVTPQDLGGGNSAEWGITSEGKLKLTSTVIDGSGSNAWKKLKEAVEAIADGGTITIDGEIKATTADNNGEIVINKNLTIKGKNPNGTDTLNANKDEGGKPVHRIFNVKENAHFTLDGLTLVGGQTPPGDPHGGAIFMSGANITSSIKNCIIGQTGNSNTASQQGGGIYLNISDGSLTLEDTQVNSCTADGGGGIYLQSGNLTFEGVQMKGNTANNGKGRAVWVEDGSFKIKDSSNSRTHLDPTTTGGKNPDDVYLAAGKTITVNGTLAGIPAGPFTSPQAARITPQNYTAGTQVVEAENGVSIGDVTNKFTVTPQTTPAKNWIIDKGGCLRDFDGIGKDVIAAFDGDMSNKTIKKYNEMIGHFIFYKTSLGNYGVLTITATPLYAADSYKMKFSYKTYDASGSVLKEGEETVTGTHSFDLDTGTTGSATSTGVDFFLHNSINIDPKNNARFFTQNPPQ